MGHNKRRQIRSKAGPWLLIFVLLFVSPAVSFSEVMVKTATMVITGTTEDNFTSDLGIFLITGKTVVLDQNGDASDLRYIRLPCRAEVDYEASDSGMPVAHKITVLETLRRKQDRDPNLPE